MSEEFPKDPNLNPNSPEQPKNGEDNPEDENLRQFSREDNPGPSNESFGQNSPEQPEEIERSQKVELTRQSKRALARSILSWMDNKPTGEDIDEYVKELEKGAEESGRSYAEVVETMLESFKMDDSEEARALRGEGSSPLVQWRGHGDRKKIVPEGTAEKTAEERETAEDWMEEYESEPFDNIKFDTDPLVKFLRECDIPVELGNIFYNVISQEEGREGKTRYDNWHETKLAIGEGKVRVGLDSELNKKIDELLKDPESKLYSRRDKLVELHKSIAAKTCADEYPEVAREMKEIRDKAWKDALDVETTPGVERNEQKMKEFDAIRLKLKEFGLNDKEIEELGPYYLAAARVRSISEENEEVVVDKLPFYHYVAVSRAQLNPEERRKADNEVFDDPEDPDVTWQKVTAAFENEGWKKLEERLTVKQYTELIRFIELKIRHEAVPDRYAEEMLAEKAKSERKEEVRPPAEEAKKVPEKVSEEPAAPSPLDEFLPEKSLEEAEKKEEAGQQAEEASQKAPPEPEKKPEEAPGEREELLMPKESAEEKMSREYGISEEDLKTIEGWDKLTEPQKKLCVENLAQMTLARLQDEAMDKYDRNMKGKVEKSGKIYIPAWLVRTWNARTKNVQIAKNKKELFPDLKHGGLETHGEILKQIVRGVKDLDVEESLGEAFVNFLSAEKMKKTGKADNKEIALTPEEEELVRQFNIAAHEYAKIPDEWGFPSSKKGFPLPGETFVSEKGEHNFARRNYRSMRNKIIEMRRKHNGGDNLEAGVFVNEIDKQVWISRFFKTHPDAEEKLNRVPEESSYWQALKDSRGESVIAFGAGFISRSVATSVLTGLAAPFAVVGISGVRGWFRGKQELREREEKMRRGKEVESWTGKEDKKLAYYEETLSFLENKQNNIKSAKDTRPVEEKERELKTLEEEKKRIGREKEEWEAKRFEKRRRDKDFVNAGDHTVERVIDGKKKQFEITGLSGKINRMVDELEKTTDEKERAEIVRELELRLTYTQEKLKEGLVRFGETGEASNQGERIAQKIDLVQAIANAAVFVGTEKIANPEFSKKRAPIDWRKDKATRAYLYREHRQKETKKAQRNYKLEKVAKAAMATGAFSAAGALWADYLKASEGESVIGRVKGAVEDLGSENENLTPEAAEAQVREALEQIEENFGDDATEETAQAPSAKGELAPRAAVQEAPEVPQEVSPETPPEVESAAPEAPKAAIVRDTAPAEEMAPEIGNDVNEKIDDIMAETSTESIADQRLEKLLDHADPAQANYMNKVKGLEEAIREMKGVEDIQSVRGHIMNVMTFFDRQPLLVQEDALERVKELRAEIERANMMSSSLSRADAWNVGDMKKRLDDMELMMQNTKAALYDKLKMLGFGVDANGINTYDRIIKDNPGMTVSAVLKAYQSDPTKEGFVKWIVEDKNIGLNFNDVSDRSIHIDDYLRAHFKLEGRRARMFRAPFVGMGRSR